MPQEDVIFFDPDRIQPEYLSSKWDPRFIDVEGWKERHQDLESVSEISLDMFDKLTAALATGLAAHGSIFSYLNDLAEKDPMVTARLNRLGTFKNFKMTTLLGGVVPFAQASIDLFISILNLYQKADQKIADRRMWTAITSLSQTFAQTDAQRDAHKTFLEQFSVSAAQVASSIRSFGEHLQAFRQAFIANEDTRRKFEQDLLANDDGPMEERKLKMEKSKADAQTALVDVIKKLEGMLDFYFGTSFIQQQEPTWNKGVDPALVLPQFVHISTLHLLFIGMMKAGGVLNSLGKEEIDRYKERYYSFKTKYYKLLQEIYGRIMGPVIGNPFASEYKKPANVEEIEEARNPVLGLVMKRYATMLIGPAVMTWEALDDEIYGSNLRNMLPISNYTLNNLDNLSKTEVGLLSANIDLSTIKTLKAMPPVLSTILFPSTTVDKMLRDPSILFPYGKKIQIFRGSNQPWLSIISEILMRHRFIQRVMRANYYAMPKPQKLQKLFVQFSLKGKDTDVGREAWHFLGQQIMSTAKGTYGFLHDQLYKAFHQDNAVMADKKKKKLNDEKLKSMKNSSWLEEGYSYFRRGVLTELKYYLAKEDGTGDFENPIFSLGGQIEPRNSPLTAYHPNNLLTKIIFNDDVNPIENSNFVGMKSKGNGLRLGYDNDKTGQGFSITNSNVDIWTEYAVLPGFEVSGITAYIDRKSPQEISNHYLQNMIICTDHSTQTVYNLGNIQRNSMTTIAAKNAYAITFAEETNNANSVNLLELNSVANQLKDWLTDVSKNKINTQHPDIQRIGNIDEGIILVEEILLANETLFSRAAIRCEYPLFFAPDEDDVSKQGTYSMRLHAATSYDTTIRVQLKAKDEHTNRDKLIQDIQIPLKQNPKSQSFLLGNAGKYSLVDIMKSQNLDRGDYTLTIDCPPGVALNKIEIIEGLVETQLPIEIQPLKQFGIIEKNLEDGRKFPQLIIQPQPNTTNMNYVLIAYDSEGMPKFSQTYLVPKGTIQQFDFTLLYDLNGSYTLKAYPEGGNEFNSQLVHADNLGAEKPIERMSIQELILPNNETVVIKPGEATPPTTNPSEFGFDQLVSYEGAPHVIVGFTIDENKQIKKTEDFKAYATKTDTNQTRNISVATPPDRLGNLAQYRLEETIPLSQYKLEIRAVYNGVETTIYKSEEHM
ncbi:hypothetical protein NPM06_23945 [Bacillus cereus]|uniref:hypothetical protein n=1 Tax=Bacillus cereus TaxID=1396 RepID=UPI00211200B5|nr:hypothetical protein [Bacillus cereus]